MPPKSIPEPKTKNWEQLKQYREISSVNKFPKPENPKAYYARGTPPQSPRQPPRSPPPAPRKKGVRQPPPPPPPTSGGSARRSLMPSYKKGGVVEKTGKALLHKGEVVIPVSMVSSLKKLLKK